MCKRCSTLKIEATVGRVVGGGDGDGGSGGGGDSGGDGSGTGELVGIVW